MQAVTIAAHLELSGCEGSGLASGCILRIQPSSISYQPSEAELPGRRLGPLQRLLTLINAFSSDFLRVAMGIPGAGGASKGVSGRLARGMQQLARRRAHHCFHPYHHWTAAP